MLAVPFVSYQAGRGDREKFPELPQFARSISPAQTMEEYFQYMASSGAGESPDGNVQDALQPHNTAMPMGSGPSSTAPPFQGIGYFSGFPDPIMFQPPKPANSRSRKKSTPGLDHVKHRRTRSGCYTCRSRRVKVETASSLLPTPMADPPNSATSHAPYVRVSKAPPASRKLC